MFKIEPFKYIIDKGAFTPAKSTLAHNSKFT